MSVEDKLFKKDYAYNEQKCEILICHIQKCRDEKQVVKTKHLLFKMMGTVVAKNVSNYLSLLNNSNCRDIPSRDDVLGIAFSIFESCVGKFKVGHGFNFYFYLNKSFSRAFFRLYQRALKNTNNVTAVDFQEMNIEYKNNGEDELNLIIETMHFTDVEKRVCWSRLRGENRATFLENNTDVTSQQYTAALNVLKEKLKVLRNER